MTPNALQISLKAMYYDRPSTLSAWGYVVAITQRNVEGEGQVYISPTSFKIRRDGDVSTHVDKVYEWDGDGKLIFSAPLNLDGQPLERVGLDLYFIRDYRRLRDAGAVLEDLFEDDGVGRDVVKIIEKAITESSVVAGVVIGVVSDVAKYVGMALQKKNDSIKIAACGSLKADSIKDHDDGDVRRWGVTGSDKGFFLTNWDLVTMNNPCSVITFPEFPESVLARIGEKVK